MTLRFLGPRITTFVLLALLCCAGGCYERVVYDHWAQFAEDTGAQMGGQSTGQVLTGGGKVEGVAILLDEFEGFDERNRAMKMLRRLDRETNMPSLWLRRVKDKVQLLRGQYVSAENEAAQRDLRQTRMATLDGQLLYEHAILIDLVTGENATAAANDLRRHSGRYTLQVGFYDEAGGKDYRALAEQAVTTLRADGEQAFYYHGATMSLVTIGLFDEADVIQTTDTLADGKVIIGQTYSQRVQALQERFAFNLANGRTLKNARTGVDQPSFLVRVP